MSRIEKHTPTGIDLADGESYRAEGPKKAELISRTNTVFERFQTVFSYFPNLAGIVLTDLQGGVWNVRGTWSEERERLGNLWLSNKQEKVHIHLDRGSTSGYPYVEYMSYAESLSESNLN